MDPPVQYVVLIVKPERGSGVVGDYVKTLLLFHRTVIAFWKPSRPDFELIGL